MQLNSWRYTIFLLFFFSEEPPSIGSAIDEPDLDVGSDDDGELEAYNMDPGEFFLPIHPLEPPPN